MKKILISFFIVVAASGFFFIKEYQKPKVSGAATYNLPSFSADQLKPFDGSDSTKPILLTMDGLVYDVTPGKEFYQVGGVYHYLAGKDSSQELHIAGGDIIKRKYKVVGVFQQ